MLSKPLERKRRGPLRSQAYCLRPSTPEDLTAKETISDLPPIPGYSMKIATFVDSPEYERTPFLEGVLCVPKFFWIDYLRRLFALALNSAAWPSSSFKNSSSSQSSLSSGVFSTGSGSSSKTSRPRR